MTENLIWTRRESGADRCRNLRGLGATHTMEYAEEPDNIEKTVLYVSLALLLAQPFLPAVDLVSPIRLAGFSLFITVLPTVILLGCFGVVVYRSQQYLVPVVLLLLATLLVNLLRDRLGISESQGILRDLNRLRYIFLIPINFAVWSYLLRRAEARSALRRCLFATTLVLGVLGFLYAIDVARIGTIILDPVNGQQVLLTDLDRVRYGGFQTSNSFGCLLATLMCYFVFADDWRRPNLKLFVLALGLVGIMPTLSRGPIILGVMLLAYYILKQARYILVGLVVLALCAGGVFVVKRNYVVELLESNIGRVGGTISGGTGREDKMRYGFSIIVDTPQNFALGIPDYMTSFGVTEEESISDNSVVLAATSGGVPLMLAGIACTWLMIVGRKGRRVLSSGYVASLGIAVIICNTYNAVIWNNWLPYISAVIVALYLRDDLRQLGRPARMSAVGVRPKWASRG